MQADGPIVTRVEHDESQGPVGTILASPFQSAIAALAKLQADLGSSISVIDAANFGPYNLGGSCSYDCVIVCWKTYDWSWKLDFENLRGPLTDIVQNLGASASQFAAAFQPARLWLKGILPQFSANFQAQAQTIEQLNAAIIAQGGVPTVLQIVQLRKAFGEIINGINIGEQQMRIAISAMVEFNQQLSGYTTALTAVTTEEKNSITNWINTTWNNFVNQMECGQSDAQNQVNQAISTFTTAIGQVQTSFQVLQSDGDAVATAIEQLVGTFANINDQYGLVAGQIGESQSYPAGPIANLHLNIAAEEWAQLAQYAQQNIQ